MNLSLREEQKMVLMYNNLNKQLFLQVDHLELQEESQKAISLATQV